MVCMSHAFVYDVVHVNIISSTKLPSYPYAQVTTGLTLYMADVPIHGEHFEPNL